MVIRRACDFQRLKTVEAVQNRTALRQPRSRCFPARTRQRLVPGRFPVSSIAQIQAKSNALFETAKRSMASSRRSAFLCGRDVQELIAARRAVALSHRTQPRTLGLRAMHLSKKIVLERRQDKVSDELSYPQIPKLCL